MTCQWQVVDWLKRRILNPDTVKVFVLDEADIMVDEAGKFFSFLWGFLWGCAYKLKYENSSLTIDLNLDSTGHRANSLLIKNRMPSTCQCLLFSATFPPQVVQFATKMVKNPDKILVEDGPEFLVLDIIKQLWIDTREYQGGKLEFLADIYSLLTIGQSIIFVSTKNEADLVHKTLSDAGYTCSILHSNVEASQRDETMVAFREGGSNVLITTNVLARGVDVDNVCLVVNYDVPTDKDGFPDFETYLHRIGRTGRFGRKGTAINLISDEKSMEALAAIEAHFSKGGVEMIKRAAANPEALAEEIEI